MLEIINISSPQLANVVICYANEMEVVQYAKELEKQSARHNVILAIVINKESELGKDFLCKSLSGLQIQTRIYDPGKNLGYLNGLMFGYQSLANDGIKSSWYIFSNTDIDLPDEDFLRKFIDSDSFGDDEIWAVGPSVYAKNHNQYSNPYKIDRYKKWDIQKTNMAMTFPYVFHLLHIIKSKIKSNSDGSERAKSSQLVYAIHGSYMFLRRELLVKISEKKPWELLYNEEAYIAEIVYGNKKRIFYSSELSVIHTEGTSTGKVNIVPRYALMKKANKRIIDEFF